MPQAFQVVRIWPDLSLRVPLRRADVQRDRMALLLGCLCVNVSLEGPFAQRVSLPVRR